MGGSTEPATVDCPGDGWDPVTATALLIGRKWHPVIIDRLLEDGPQGFNQLHDQVDGVSKKVLSESLEDLQAKGLVTRDVVSERPYRVEYSLTERGEALQQVVDAMATWGRTHLQPPVD